MARNSRLSDEERESLLDAISAHNSLKRADAAKLLESVESRSAKRNPLLQERWVTTLYAACCGLCDGRGQEPGGALVSVFWIRLYGAITEIRHRFEKSSELHDAAVDAGKTLPHLVAAKEVFLACDAIQDSLSDDELVFVTFLRHVHAHVYQDGFEPSAERGKPGQPAALRRNQTVRPLQVHVPIDKAHEIVDRVFQENGNSDTAVALAFARKLQPAIERLYHAMVAYSAALKAGG